MLGPPSPGIRAIEVDLVHEHVRWFGCGVRATIEIRKPSGKVRQVRPPLA